MAKKTTKTKDSFTVKDFKMWLSGLTEFQEAGWTPNTKQWKTILDKVEMLQDDVQYIYAETVSSEKSVPQNPQTQAQQTQTRQGFESFDISTQGGGEPQTTTRFHEERPRHHNESYGSQTGIDSGIIDGFNKSFI